MLIGTQLSYWGDLALGLGYVGGVMLLCRVGWRAPAVAAVGRTALSNYVLQTLICTTVFYGHGLGRFGRVDRVGQLLIVLAGPGLSNRLDVRAAGLLLEPVGHFAGEHRGDDRKRATGGVPGPGERGDRLGQRRAESRILASDEDAGAGAKVVAA